MCCFVFAYEFLKKIWLLTFVLTLFMSSSGLNSCLNFLTLCSSYLFGFASMGLPSSSRSR